ncbi:MAG: hypothetical protein KKH93_05215, partial [Candidatus Omnitrophica bacterium]|nr:hypothetical protein [Candidatus Omnitrophota bacterium]
IKTGRKGPLWESRFSNVLVETDEQLAHLTRYIHLNPTTVYLVNKPQDWSFSSYQEFLGLIEKGQGLCNYFELMHVVPESYQEFVNLQINYQRELADIKRLFLE